MRDSRQVVAGGFCLMSMLALLTACGPAPGAGAPPTAATVGATATASSGATLLAAPEPLRVLYVVRNGAMAPLWVAYEDGIFARHGIEADLQYISSGTLGMQALLAKEVDIGVAAASSAAAANLNGADAVYLGAIQRTFALWIYTLPDLTTPADLRGKRVGFVRRGSTGEMGLAHYLDRYGLRIDRDVFGAELGEVAAALPALASGAVRGASSATRRASRRGGWATTNWPTWASSASSTRNRRWSRRGPSSPSAGASSRASCAQSSRRRIASRPTGSWGCGCSRSTLARKTRSYWPRSTICTRGA